MASGPITSWQIDGENVETVSDFIFLGSEINVDDDCSHEIKRHLLLGRIAMTNLESLLKSRDITLTTKIHIVKAMVFPVVMYGFESWTIKKAEHKRIDGFELWCWIRLLRVSSTARVSNQSINQGNQFWIFSGKTDAEAPILWHLMQRADSLEKTLMLGKIEGKRRRGNRGWDVWHHWLNSREFGHVKWMVCQWTWVWANSDSEGQRNLACCSSWDRKESDTT